MLLQTYIHALLSSVLLLTLTSHSYLRTCKTGVKGVGWATTAQWGGTIKTVHSLHALMKCITSQTYHLKDELVTNSPQLHVIIWPTVPGRQCHHLVYSYLCSDSPTVLLIVPGVTWTIQGRPGMAISCHNSVSDLYQGLRIIQHSSTGTTSYAMHHIRKF